MVFWALSLSPGKEYSQVVDMGFFVTMAALGLPAEAEEASGRKGGKRKRKSGASDAVAAPSTVMVRVENTDYMVCTLRAGTRDQQALSLKFSEGEEIAFTNLGDQVVHLTGYAEELDVANYMSSDEEEYMDDFVVPDGEVEEMSTSEEEESAEETDQSAEEEKPQKAAKAEKRKSAEAPATTPKKAKRDKQAKEAQEAAKQKAAAEAARAAAALAKQAAAKKAAEDLAAAKKEAEAAKAKKKAAEKKAAEEKAKQDKIAAKRKEANLKAQKAKKQLPKGVVAEILQQGSGAIAKRGKRVSVNYVGRLAKNGKEFDRSRGRPFTFKLGAGDVIQGWDIGVADMKIGEKRRLTIPAAAGYGTRGAPPDIPGGATLVFDVELKNVR